MRHSSLIMDDIEVKEGYLCPICVKDLGTIEELTAHFEAAHSAEEKDVLQSLKGLIGRAKRKILKEKDLGDSRAEEDDNGPDSFSRLNWDYQEIGATQRHTEAFRSIRSQRVERYVSQTNKLLIRLGKLLSDAPADPEKRRHHDNGIEITVRFQGWSSILWFFCSSRESFLGAHLKTNVSEVIQLSTLELRLSRVFIRAAIISKEIDTWTDESRSGILTSLGTLLSVHVSGKLMNLTALSTPRSSVAGPLPETSLRVCRDCLHLLNRRDQLRDQGTPKLVVMYQKMKQSMDEAEHILPQYYKIIDSLHNGQTSHTLEEAQMLRVQLTKIAERVDLLSRQIGALGSEEGGGPSPRALQLQGGVRLAASNFLRQWLLGLPGPPSPEELQRLQGAREGACSSRSRGTRPPLCRLKGNPCVSPFVHLRKLGMAVAEAAESGWSPASVASGSAGQDPMVLQMGIIRGYIRQAREARRYDEVAILEANLKELKREYMSMTLGQPPGRES
uniref:C2H2-type domain-containing protein n=1 Tax=Ixodes scapularis TaxID=6945 RepID=A0A1S4M1Q4_IXOSC